MATQSNFGGCRNSGLSGSSSAQPESRPCGTRPASSAPMIASWFDGSTPSDRSNARVVRVVEGRTFCEGTASAYFPRNLGIRPASGSIIDNAKFEGR